MDTNKLKQVFRNNYVRYGIILIAGLLLGWLIFSGGSESIPGEDHSGHTHEMTTDENGKQVWTCSMHPQIKMDKPGKCPICAMDLIPLKTTGSGDAAIDPSAIQMSAEAVALANIQTTVVSKQNPVKELRLYGTVQADERLSQSQTSHVNGRIEKLFVNFTGERVGQGQTIATIYSPELLSAQQELLEAAKMQSVQPTLLQAAREKLRLWKLTDEQISRIERSKTVSPYVEVKATTSGIVVGKKVSQGDYINQGNVLFDIANLSRVWIMFDAYESDLPFLKVGDKLEYSLQALPGKTFSGTISFINPILDPVTRTVKIRIEASNPGTQLKPEMYANAVIKSPLNQYDNQFVIPKSAILWTGKRSIVYMKQPGTVTPSFMLHQVELGPSLGDSYVVLSGINDGDEIVTNGVFTIDASAQLEGKHSMMNESSSRAVTGHEGHNMSGGSHAGHDMSSMSGSSQQGMSAKSERSIIQVQGLCEICKNRIEKAAKSVNGVISATWDEKTKQLQLNFDPSKTSLDKISGAIAKAGHDTDKHKASKAAYDALPSCCKYRNS
ncbi:efflux RND transporter periplasmic adaptor subunit [Dysgonomonas mossii]|uniref:Efflux RND transporter periplasmic adaptor subunit n=2 Tax=Bacteria TaxID=2 RepID=A0A4Y9IK52_9BACT|nr:efflux RND transporter periplasmic adaptor subunit [Dysgonomonas mossii]MBF0762030.1 efflux RND transporter periplasmic adaptor subunit [Dysgonomonas mossii]TFU88850.1 efflux RND transporter periplasmic adaptor subunit [Dysgonomonas mossii]